MKKAKTVCTKGQNDSIGWANNRAQGELEKVVAAVKSFGKMNSGLIITSGF